MPFCSSTHSGSASGMQPRKQHGARYARRGVVILVAVILVAALSAATSVPTAQAVCVPDNWMSPTSPPELTGSATVGGTLTTTNGTWPQSDASIRIYYQWYRDDVQITGAISQSYVVQAVDAGSVIYATVTLLGCVWGGKANSNSVQIEDTGDEMGTLEPDQAAETGDDTTSSPASAQPISPTGPVPPSSYTTELWDESETGSTDGLKVVSSTAAGTVALTGIAKDPTDLPVSGATVTLASGTTSVTATSNAAGAFAFINMPAGTYAMTVNAPGFGTYQLVNNTMEANEQYAVTSDLDATAQTIDGSETGANVQQTAAAGDPGTAYSERRVPPSIRVAKYDTYPVGAVVGGRPVNCERKPTQPSPIPVHRWPFDYYIERVSKEEVGTSFYNQVGQKAFFALIQNYAWFHKTIPGPFDVDNSTSFQCFRPSRFVPRRWRTWIRDVLDERVVKWNGRLLETLYNAGTSPPRCNDPLFPSGGSIASQNTIKALTQQSCPLRTDWRNVVLNWYGTGSQASKVVDGRRPPPPTVDWSTTTGSNRIVFDVRSRVYGENVAWYFRVQRRTSTGWRRVAMAKWRWGAGASGGCSWSARTVQSCLSVTVPDSGCYRYRVQAGNPYAWSLPGQVTPIGTGIRVGEGTCML
jgi:hypothetical protein